MALQPTNMQAASPASKPETEGSPAHKHGAVVSPSSPQAKMKFSKLSSPPSTPTSVFLHLLFPYFFKALFFQALTDPRLCPSFSFWRHWVAKTLLRSGPSSDMTCRICFPFCSLKAAAPVGYVMKTTFSSASFHSSGSPTFFFFLHSFFLHFHGLSRRS